LTEEGKSDSIIYIQVYPWCDLLQFRDNMMSKITGYIEKDLETGLYVGIVPGIPGAHTQAETLDELQENLKEVVELCLEEMDEEARKQIPEFFGIQQLEVAG
jgi:predicted RNase H-like HicB family nuclease